MMNIELLTNIAGWELHVFQILEWAALLSAMGVFAINAKPDSFARKFLFILSVFSFSAPVLHVATVAYFYMQTGGDYILPLPQSEGRMWVGLWLIGLVAAMLWLRFAPQRMNTALAKFALQNKLERNHKTDVRTIREALPKPAAEHDFDPVQYFDQSKGIFIGEGENDEPIYAALPQGGIMPHCSVTGTSGANKGVLLGVICTQLLERGEAIFWCDPKNDEWAPSLMFAAATRLKKPYYYIDLNSPDAPQFNLFEGATRKEAFEVFLAGFSLSDRGDTADFYGIADRYQARLTAKMIAEKKMNLAQAYVARKDELHDKETGAEKFAGRMREMAEVPAINALPGSGVNLEKIVKEGGVIYVVGSCRDDIVKTVQRMLLVRIIQLAERRDRIAGGLRPVCLVLDEVKYHLSRPALEALGTARDKAVHAILAFQANEDLRDCPADLNGDAVVGSITENCAWKLCYNLKSPLTAEWFAKMSGTIQADDETRKVTRNLMQADIVDKERSIKQTERYFIDSNMLLYMPKGVGVLYDGNLPRFVAVKHITVNKSRAAITVEAVEGGAAPLARDAITI